MKRRVNIVIVPAEGGAPRSYSVSHLTVKVAAVALAAFLLIVAVLAVSWTGLARKSLDYDRLLAQKARLEAENRRVLKVTREMERSRQILARIVRSLGGRMELGAGEAAIDTSFNEDDFTREEADLPPAPLAASAAGALFANLETPAGYVIPSLMPADGFVSRRFFEDHIFPQRSHRGIDIAGKTGAPILAAAEGRVVFSGWTQNYGNCLLIAHLGGYLTFYGHALYNLKGAREEVRRGEPVALVGSSGQSSAPHLHFEIWKDGIPLDPLEFILPAD